jgi:hypothetical protein
VFSVRGSSARLVLRQSQMAVCSSILWRSGARFALLLVTLASLAFSPAACGVAGEDVDTTDDALTFEPTVKGFVNGGLRKLSAQEALDLRFVSHEKILTWEGLIADFGKPNAEVHLVDTKKFDGHFGYTQNALGRGPRYTQDNFFTEVQFPRTRKYMPFLVFDFRAQPIQVGGKRFKWVMNIRRYNYRDTEAELAGVLKSVRSLLSDRLMKSFGEPVLFVYDSTATFPSTGALRRPHVTQLRDVRAAGFDVLTEGEMIRSAGGQLVSVLNPGVAVGFLKLIRQGETEERLTPRHIAVFQDTPERVPPVSGIVTLEPQTPLSHINLLAKNRGTPNVSTAQIALIPGMEALLGKLVRMEAEASGAIRFKEVTMEEATAFWASKQQNALEVPKIAPVSLEPVEFATASGDAVQLPNIGSKGSNYAKIQKLLGAPLVRPGFGLGFAHYRALISGSPAEALIADLIAKKDTLPPEDVDARLAAIRASIQTASPEAALAVSTAAVRTIASRLPGVPRIRFRSSTNSEDLPVFNGAGLYESNGFDVADSDGKLRKKLLEVMASLWLERAFWERELFGIKHAEVGMAILVNQAFSDELANGVVVGSREESDGAFSSWVNAQSGEASVTNPLNGEVPESFTVSPGPSGTLAITKLDSRSNIANVFLEDGSDVIRSAIGVQLRQLHDATAQLHAHFVAERRAEGDTQPYAIDIEYKLMKEADGVKLYVKQSRLLALR